MDAVVAQEFTGGICTVNLEALLRGAVLMSQAHVVEHRARVKQLGIKPQSATLACQSAPVIDAPRMMKQQRPLGIAHQFRYLASELAVGYADCRQIGVHWKVDVHSM